MEINFTKAKWRVADGFREITTSRPGILEGSKCICKISDFGKSNIEWEANAKLIASAPDLLEALIKLRNFSMCCVDWTGEDPPIELVDAAIKKATE